MASTPLQYEVIEEARFGIHGTIAGHPGGLAGAIPEAPNGVAEGEGLRPPAAQDLTRGNIMRQAANLHDLHLPLLQSGITVNTGPDDYAPVKEGYLMRFDGNAWRQAGGVLK